MFLLRGGHIKPGKHSRSMTKSTLCRNGFDELTLSAHSCQHHWGLESSELLADPPGFWEGGLSYRSKRTE